MKTSQPLSKQHDKVLEKTPYQAVQDLVILQEQISFFENSINNMKKNTVELEMLGVNATIQAAHAEEKGKGFMIVADQLHKLSRSSKENIEEMKKQLKLFQENIDSLKRNYNKAIQSIKNENERGQK